MAWHGMVRAALLGSCIQLDQISTLAPTLNLGDMTLSSSSSSLLRSLLHRALHPNRTNPFRRQEMSNKLCDSAQMINTPSFLQSIRVPPLMVFKSPGYMRYNHTSLLYECNRHTLAPMQAIKPSSTARDPWGSHSANANRSTSQHNIQVRKVPTLATGYTGFRDVMLVVYA